MADVTVEFGAKIDQLVSGVGAVKGQLESLNSTVSKLQGTFSNLGKTALGVFGLSLSTSGINSFVRDMADAGLRSEQLAAQLGVTGKGLGEIKAIAKLTGVDMDAMALGIERLSLNVQNATRDAFSPQAQALKVLGLSTKELIGLPADQYFNVLAGAVSKFNPSLNLTNALMQLGGRSVVQMLPALLQGQQAFEKWGEALRAARTGLAGFAPAAADTHARLVIFDATIDSVGKRIFLALKPAIDLVIESMTRFLQSLNAEKIRGFAIAITDGLSSAIIGLIALFERISPLIDAVMARMEKIGQGATIAMRAIQIAANPGGAIGGKLAEGIIAAWEAWRTSNQTGAAAAAKDVETQGQKIINEVMAFRDKLKAALSGASPSSGKGEGGDRQDAPAINAGARQQLEAKRAAIEGEIALAKGGLEQQKVLFQQGADLYQISEQKKLEFTRSAATAEYQTEIAKLTQIRDLWPAHTKEWEEANRKMALTSQSFGTEILRINADMMRDYKAKFDDVFGALQGSFNSQLRGLLAGTTSFKQAFKSIMGDMLIFFIQLVEKMVFQWIAGKLAMLAVDQSTSTASAAAEVTAREATLPARIAAFTSDITAAAALAFANTYAALAAFPPAAAAAGAGSEAVVLSQLAAVPKFELGTDYVPYTGLAVVHQGEKITPAGENRGGGGGSVINISAWDAQSVARWLQGGGAEMIAKASAKAMTKNRSLRPGY